MTDYIARSTPRFKRVPVRVFFKNAERVLYTYIWQGRHCTGCVSRSFFDANYSLAQ